MAYPGNMTPSRHCKIYTWQNEKIWVCSGVAVLETVVASQFITCQLGQFITSTFKYKVNSYVCEARTPHVVKGEITDSYRGIPTRIDRISFLWCDRITISFLWCDIITISFLWCDRITISFLWCDRPRHNFGQFPFKLKNNASLT